MSRRSVERAPPPSLRNDAVPPVSSRQETGAPAATAATGATGCRAGGRRSTGPGRKRSSGRTAQRPRRGRSTSPDVILPRRHLVKRRNSEIAVRGPGSTVAGVDCDQPGRVITVRTVRVRRTADPVRRANRAPRRRPRPATTCGASDGRCRVRTRQVNVPRRRDRDQARPTRSSRNSIPSSPSANSASTGVPTASRSRSQSAAGWRHADEVERRPHPGVPAHA